MGCVSTHIWDLKLWVVPQLVRQLVSRYQVSLYLWWFRPELNYYRVSKYYDLDCSWLRHCLQKKVFMLLIQNMRTFIEVNLCFLSLSWYMYMPKNQWYVLLSRIFWLIYPKFFLSILNCFSEKIKNKF